MPPSPSKQLSKSNKASPSSFSSEVTALSTELIEGVWMSVAIYVIFFLCQTAYRIRLLAIEEFGTVIHEFDPWFNYRATEYLYYNGKDRFFKWFDHMSWYPLGRPVGTTIYPGMQFIAVWIKRYLLDSWSLNDICCYIPAWFGVIASIFTALIAYECTIPQNTHSNIFRFLVDMAQGVKTERPVTQHPPSLLGGIMWSPAVEAALCTLGIMAIVPAHLMRSVGGGYDNESVATTAMIMSFYFWVRSLRCHDATSHWWGIATGISYFTMAATWGGYVFVLNMIAVHAVALILWGRFDTKIWAAYSLFYLVGTLLAIMIPVVGWTPVTSLEQLGPCAVFFLYQAMQFCDVIRSRNHLSRKDSWRLQWRVVGGFTLVVAVLVFALTPQGYFGPMSARVRGLFVKHTKTGNPLVDSVAEHQATTPQAYFQYLHHVCTLAPIGYMLVFGNMSDASSFLIVWGAVAYFFSHKMIRLILLMGPIGSILGGIASGRIFSWALHQWWDDQDMESQEQIEQDTNNSTTPLADDDKTGGGNKPKESKMIKDTQTKSPTADDDSVEGLVALHHAVTTALKTGEGILFKRTLALLLLIMGCLIGNIFVKYCFHLAVDLSNPSIILKARDREDKIIKVDDYREAYWWLRDNTPSDARVMAWWDYGYQITGIANRTTLADGNTWNHDHIALLGLTLTTDLDSAWEIARHWADYVLVWAGGRGDDMAKSPHMARIANSVFRNHCPGDPTCRAFGFLDRDGTPSDMMSRSLLYRLHSHKIRPGVTVPEDKFEEVYTSKYGFVRIYQILEVSEESKQYAADPANKLCDAPGSWYCPGQYPPALASILVRKTEVAQLEDFNGSVIDDENREVYFEALNNPEEAKRRALVGKEGTAEYTADDEIKNIDEIYNTWEDTEDTTRMWKLISSSSINELKEWLEAQPEKAFIRSRDGRGPMWWAFEQRNEQITNLLMKVGVPHTDRDTRGLTPVDLLGGGS